VTLPPHGWVRIGSTDPPVSVTARLSDARPNVDAGYGGWAEVARPRRRPLSIWNGSPGLRLTLPILLDGYRAGTSVERDIAKLEKLALPTAADGSPPRCRVTARGSAVPHQNRSWVIDTLTWGDPAIMNKHGNRTRQQVTIAFLEYIADVRVASDSAVNRRAQVAANAKRKQGAATKRIVAGANRRRTASSSSRAAGLLEPAFVTVQPAYFGAGEDLLSIAARELGDADRWVEIAELNQLRDPRSITPGQVLRLP